MNNNKIKLIKVISDKKTEKKEKHKDIKVDVDKDDYCTVTELNERIKKIIGNDFNVKVRGELSGGNLCKGILYATLKDDETKIQITKFRDDGEILNGDVYVDGKLDYFMRGGKLGILVNKIESTGIGEFMTKYEKDKEKYKKLGYFDKSAKLKQPDVINTLGIVTSLSGAVIQDIKNGLTDKNFVGKIIIKNVAVQGSSSSKSIKEGIEYFNKRKIDALLITRGGGSFEDLINFSDPLVIEAIHKCKIYTISAVGHETDNMLSDYVADIRKPTPSYAAEFISSINDTYYGFIDDKHDILTNIKKEIKSDIKIKIDKLNDLLNYADNNQFQTYKIALNNLENDIYNDILIKSQSLKQISTNLDNKNNYFFDSIKNILNTIKKDIYNEIFLSKQQLNQILKNLEDKNYYFFDIIKNTIGELKKEIDNEIVISRHKLQNIGYILKKPNYYIDTIFNNLADQKENAIILSNSIFEGYRYSLKNIDEKIKKNDINKILKFGFSLISSDNIPIKSIKNIKNNQKVKLMLEDGEIEITIKI